MPGTARRMDAKEVRQGLVVHAPFRVLLLRYCEDFKAQSYRRPAAIGGAILKKRRARWLLMAQGRIEGDELPRTQEFIAVMLGIHRSGRPPVFFSGPD
jgi:hypothetical protein